ncbi:MAG: hypothetical protein ACM3ZC_07770 [Bacteroidota bacterium]
MPVVSLWQNLLHAMWFKNQGIFYVLRHMVRNAGLFDFKPWLYPFVALFNFVGWWSFAAWVFLKTSPLAKDL